MSMPGRLIGHKLALAALLALLFPGATALAQQAGAATSPTAELFLQLQQLQEE